MMSIVWFSASFEMPSRSQPIEMAITSRAKSHEAATCRRREM